MKETKFETLKDNAFDLIGNDWMLISAGNEKGFNAMTASWGHLGSLWGHGGGRPTAIAYIRPSRYTKEFVDREDVFTLSFFSKDHKKALAYLGTHSGRDENKVSKVGFTPIFHDGTVSFKEAKLVLVCKKLYVGKIEEDGFIDKSIIDDCYPIREYHTFYIGEIIKTYQED